MHGHVLIFYPTSSWRSTFDLFGQNVLKRHRHIDRNLIVRTAPSCAFLQFSLTTGAQVAQPQTSFWPGGGRGKAAPEALRGIPHGTPVGGPAPPGQKRGGVRCTALTSGAFDISALRPATGLGLERREASAAPKKAQEGEGSEFLGAQPARRPIFFLRQLQLREETLVRDYTEAGNRSA